MPTERALLMNATRIAEDVNAAADLLAGDRGARSRASGRSKRLSRMNEEARRAAASAETALDQAYTRSRTRGANWKRCSRASISSRGSWRRSKTGIHDLRAAARKYGVPPDALPASLADFRVKQRRAHAAAAGDLEGGGGTWPPRATLISPRRTSFRQSRAAAARRLEAAVAGELAPLKLGHAKFRVALETLDEDAAGANGLERVAFEVATVEGAAFGSLTRIASGGELARFSLALKVALAEATPPAALVFDEVDRGVGGAVADAVGERLQRLAQTTQVLLVTHSPQVAARAERHFRITRSGDKTKVELLDDDARMEEVARMLSGAAVTEEARAAARRLIARRRRRRRRRRKRA